MCSDVLRCFQIITDVFGFSLDILSILSIGSMDFDNPKVYGDTSITDGLVTIDWQTH